MGSKSTAVDTTSNTTTNLALSRDAITESGTQILDSIVVDMSDQALANLVNGFKASFAVLMDGTKANIQDVIGLGQDVLTLADKNQIKMSGMMQDTLRQNLDWLSEQSEMGRYVIDFSARSVDQSYDFAGAALATNAQALNRALDIAADVQTGDASANMRSVTTLVLLFSLAIVYMTRGK